jgi:hypothetical protein
MTVILGNVVPETSSVTEDQFHGAMVAGLGRAERSAGAKALAYVMDVTTKQLGNIFKGSTPNAKRLWDARKANPTVLDDIADLYGCKIVSKALDDAANDIGTLPIATLLARVAAAEAPDSPGGVKKTHTELLDMEAEIRAVHALTADWIERINATRADARVGTR